MADQVEVAAADEELKDSGKKPDGTPYKVLITDDSAFILKQLARVLTSAGYEIIGEAENGRKAVEFHKARGAEIDATTMDITMPEMNGIEAVEGILAINPTAKIIMVSALGHESLVKQAILRGAKHFIVKPFQREQVLKILKGVLAK
ncbi:MAG TPA: response regulator [bacterium]|nr:response regulator [bacterium]